VIALRLYASRNDEKEILVNTSLFPLSLALIFISHSTVTSAATDFATRCAATDVLSGAPYRFHFYRVEWELHGHECPYYSGFHLSEERAFKFPLPDGRGLG
jgi:hypothetical protein